MFVKGGINTRVNMQMTTTQRPEPPAPVPATSRVLPQTSRGTVKPMLVTPKPQQKGCRSCGS